MEYMSIEYTGWRGGDRTHPRIGEFGKEQEEWETLFRGVRGNAYRIFGERR
jgi:hypothetical protein